MVSEKQFRVAELLLASAQEGVRETLSESDQSVCLSVPSGQMPRSAFGHIFGTQLSACWELGLLPRPEKEYISEMIDRLS